MATREASIRLKKKYKAERKCIACGKQDERTLAGYAMCKACADRKSTRYYIKKAKNAAIRQVTLRELYAYCQSGIDCSDCRFYDLCGVSVDEWDLDKAQADADADAKALVDAKGADDASGADDADGARRTA